MVLIAGSVVGATDWEVSEPADADLDSVGCVEAFGIAVAWATSVEDDSLRDEGGGDGGEEVAESKGSPCEH